jgi:hypothetical protein
MYFQKQAIFQTSPIKELLNYPHSGAEASWGYQLSEPNRFLSIPGKLI